ncbi:hypothetical protein DRN73_06445 [Candidatus Pacearchaeota archaeon]|nr:MAG: hypothetical protein DRN73_06445 [Candidatus Pacearchaeota archaeon]
MIKKKKSSKTKRSSSKKTAKKKPKISIQEVEIKMEPVLVENFIALQKVMVNLSTKFNELNSHLNKLLDLFEISAKTLAKKGFNLEGGEESNKEILNKLENLSEQNKVIAKGLTLLHEAPRPAQSLTPIPSGFSSAENPLKPLEKKEEYKKSIPSKSLKKETAEPAKK